MSCLRVMQLAIILVHIAFGGCLGYALEAQQPLSRMDAGIPQSTYADLTRFAKYSSAAYQVLCPRPLGNTRVKEFRNLATSTAGYIARDDQRREIVVAFRGSQQLKDFLVDGALVQVPYESPGVQLNTTDVVMTHAGFLLAYNSVYGTVLDGVGSQLKQHKNYSIVSTGHSLGGALASLGSLSIKSNFPMANVRLYTFGQPRTGNAAYADLVQQVVGSENIYRAVHTYDGVPTMVPEELDYRHHEREFWQFEEPPEPATVIQCEGQEDPTCSDSIPTTGINVAHPFYFGQIMSLDATLCL